MLTLSGRELALRIPHQITESHESFGVPRSTHAFRRLIVLREGHRELNTSDAQRGRGIRNVFAVQQQALFLLTHVRVRRPEKRDEVVEHGTDCARPYPKHALRLRRLCHSAEGPAGREVRGRGASNRRDSAFSRSRWKSVAPRYTRTIPCSPGGDQVRDARLGRAEAGPNHSATRLSRTGSPAAVIDPSPSRSSQEHLPRATARSAGIEHSRYT